MIIDDKKGLMVSGALDRDLIIATIIWVSNSSGNYMALLLHFNFVEAIQCYTRKENNR